MKSILIIDTPEDCLACPCFSVIGSEHCSVTMKEIGQHIPSWCPLRQIPDKAAEDLAKGLDAMEKMEHVEVRTIRRTE